MKKIWKNKKFWVALKTSIVWLIVFYFVVTLGYIFMLNPKNTLELKDKHQVNEQDLYSCQKELSLYRDQIDSGSVKIIRGENCEQQIERWEVGK